VSLSCGEKVDDDAVSVKALLRDVVLCEWNGSCRKPPKPSGLSFKLSWLCALRSSGDASGESGDVPLGVCDEEAAAEMPSASSGASELFRDRAPIKLLFSLNFSSQVVLNTCWFSGLVVVAEKARAWSRMASSVSFLPFFSCQASLERNITICTCCAPGSSPKQQAYVRCRASVLSHASLAICSRRPAVSTSPSDAELSIQCCNIISTTN